MLHSRTSCSPLLDFNRARNAGLPSKSCWASICRCFVASPAMDQSPTSVPVPGQLAQCMKTRSERGSSTICRIGNSHRLGIAQVVSYQLEDGVYQKFRRKFTGQYLTTDHGIIRPTHCTYFGQDPFSCAVRYTCGQSVSDDISGAGFPSTFYDKWHSKSQQFPSTNITTICTVVIHHFTTFSLLRFRSR